MKPTRPFILALGLGVAALLLIALGTVYLPGGVDWYQTNRPAALSLLAGRSPYADVAYLSAAPWGIALFIPLALFPEQLGRALFFAVSLGAFFFVAYRLKAKPLALALFLLSPPVLHCLINANLDWLPLLGFVLPPQIGFFFLAIKPQVGSGVALFWLVEAWRRGGVREIWRICWPVGLAYLVSFGLFGFWPANYWAIANHSQGWNASLWPYSIPVGLALLVAALRQRKINYAMAASPCLSPYVLFHAWSGALVALVSSQAEFLAAVVGLWVLVIIRALSGAGG